MEYSNLIVLMKSAVYGMNFTVILVTRIEQKAKQTITILFNSTNVHILLPLRLTLDVEIKDSQILLKSQA
jgi:hypothetical protein